MRTTQRLLGGGCDGADVTAATAYTVAAYAYVAMRWRAARLAETPYTVVRENQDDGADEWLPQHALAPLLDAPSPDYAMSELMFRTSLAIDADGAALWVVTPDGRGRPGRLDLITQESFAVEPTADRRRGMFVVQAGGRRERIPAERAVYWHEPHPTDWTRGTSRVDVFLGWLNLAHSARTTIRDLLANSLHASLIVQPDAEWNPSPEEFARFRDQLDDYARPGHRGRALTLLGGGTATPILASAMQSVVPAELLNRVESIAAAVFGVPAIVLQYEVGLQNSPWSQMAQARRMAYEDTAEPMWKSAGDVLTRQLLRTMDADTTLYVRADTSRVRALQRDQISLAPVATQWAPIATLNERRALVGLEPMDDALADEAPWVRDERRMTATRDAALAAAVAATQRSTEPRAASDADAPGDVKAAPHAIRIKAGTPRDALAALAEEATIAYEAAATIQLHRDLTAITRIVGEAPPRKAAGPDRRRLQRTITTYLDTASTPAWEAAASSLAARYATRSLVAVLGGMGVAFDVVPPGVTSFIASSATLLARSVTDTTLDAVMSAIDAGLAAGTSTREIAASLSDLAAFGADRSMLIARTETTRVLNGAPFEALGDAQAAGRRFTKTWSTALDDRVRPEHMELEGVTIPRDAEFANGLAYPSEPNCRCTLLYTEIDA